MCNTEINGNFEIYKLHAELADKEIHRLYGTSQLFVSLFVGLMVLIVALFQFNIEHIYKQAIPFTVGQTGLFLSVCWYLVIRSRRHLITQKYRTLLNLGRIN